ncbi:MAG: hypothetical protein IJU55_05020 [Selenomonadaceae bacterium]|nr:hypothetical protein [Selenomonadaceae bacterium]
MGIFDFFGSKKDDGNVASLRKNTLPAFTIEEQKEILADVEKEIYGYGEEVSHDVWHFFGGVGHSCSAETECEGSQGFISNLKKKQALRLICRDIYTENDLVRIVVTKNISAGWAFTKDSFCLGGRWSIVYGGNLIIPYGKIMDASFNPLRDEFSITYNIYDENVEENLSINEEYAEYADSSDSGYKDMGNGKKSISIRSRSELAPAQGKDFKILCNYLQAVMNFYK